MFMVSFLGLYILYLQIGMYKISLQRMPPSVYMPRTTEKQERNRYRDHLLIHSFRLDVNF